jgi:hypothetical protein
LGEFVGAFFKRASSQMQDHLRGKMLPRAE